MSPEEVLREMVGAQHYGVQFDEPVNSSDDPLENGMRVDATIQFETYPIWPTLYTNVVLVDGDWVFPEPEEVLTGLDRATLVREPSGGGWWILEFDSNYNESEFEVQTTGRIGEGGRYGSIEEVAEWVNRWS